MGAIDYIALDVFDLDRPLTSIREENGRWRLARDDSYRQAGAALDCGNFQIRRGEIFGILSKDDSTKSALAHRIAALLMSDERRITVSGRSVLRDQSAVKRLINRVLTDVALFHTLTPLENLIYGARLKRLGGSACQACARSVLAQLGLDEAAIVQPTGVLSPALQQKVADACAALTPPALLVLDDPMAGSPQQSWRDTRAFLRELRDVYNATILLLMMTGNAREADTLCDRVAILGAERITALDTPANLKRLLCKVNGHAVTLADVCSALTCTSGGSIQ